MWPFILCTYFKRVLSQCEIVQADRGSREVSQAQAQVKIVSDSPSKVAGQASKGHVIEAEDGKRA